MVVIGREAECSEQCDAGRARTVRSFSAGGRECLLRVALWARVGLTVHGPGVSAVVPLAVREKPRVPRWAQRVRVYGLK